MVAGTTYAVVLGLCLSVPSTFIWGTASLPFIVGSSIGFTIGSIRWYTVATQEALWHLDRYPSLMRLHIMANYPWRPDLRTKKLEWYNSERFSRSWVLRSILVASWLSAQPALDDLHGRNQAAIVEEYMNKESKTVVEDL